jgi:regulation of enolase protein 1 (concanavalin A-like superfamily)
LLVVFLFSVMGTVGAQDDVCSKEAVLKGFNAATDVAAWVQTYAESKCPPYVKRAVTTLAAAYDLLDSKFISFATGSDTTQFSPVWKWYRGKSASGIFTIDAEKNELTLLADTQTDQKDKDTTAPVLAYPYSGNFVVQVRLNFQKLTGSPDQLAALGVRDPANPNQWIRIERTSGDTIQVSVDQNGTSSVVQSVAYSGEEEVLLRIERRSGRFSLYYSLNGDTWLPVAQDYSFDLPEDVEIYLTTTWPYDTGAASARFSEFAVKKG